ncbi:MAG TPA: hypothetical protein VN428_24935 [Bryobacteraceae bacterium]|nr:hypothetical protein [Bryobacteraceae bacterium]
MELRSQAAIACAVLMLAATAAAADDLRIEARHPHLKGACKGTLVFGETGLAYESAKHRFSWPYEEIQKLEISPDQARVTTYEDRRWRLGQDREVRFTGSGFERAYPVLRERLDQRLTANLADDEVRPVWEAPAKLSGLLGGPQGTLLFGEERIVFRAGKRSRTWRLSDVESISMSGPFDFTVATVSGPFRFQLKQPLSEAAYDGLWKRLHRYSTSLNHDSEGTH